MLQLDPTGPRIWSSLLRACAAPCDRRVPHLDSGVIGAREDERRAGRQRPHGAAVALERCQARQVVHVPHADRLVVAAAEHVAAAATM